MRLADYFKGLEYEPTIERFWQRHRDKIALLSSQYMEATSGYLGSSAMTEVAINEYLSTFDEYYQGIIKLLVRGCALGYLHEKGGNLALVPGTLRNFTECNKGELNSLYGQFRERYHLAHTKILADMFRYGVEDYLKAKRADR